MTSRKKDYQFRFGTSIGILILFALLFYVVGQACSGLENKVMIWVSNIANNIAAALCISGILGIINEYILKEKLVELILGKIALREDISVTGVESVVLNVNKIDYEAFFEKATREIDIVHVYGRTFTAKNLDVLKKKLLNSNCKIRVILLSPKSKFMPALAEYYDKGEDNLLRDMKDVIKLWQNLYKDKLHQSTRRSTQSNLRVYYHNSQPSYSLYRSDDKIITISNSLTKGRTAELPSIICQDTHYDGDLFDIYKQQIDGLVDESEEIDLKSIN